MKNLKTFKCLLAFIVGLVYVTTTDAQTTGIVYYLKNSGKLVSTKDSADYSMVVLPPDTSVDKTMYLVYEYNKDGRIRMATKSKTNDLNLKYEGSFISYYPDGKKRQTGRYDNGAIIGRVVEYYTNGKLYNSVNYHNDGVILYGTCRDSLGTVLAENGTGNWIQFDDGFKSVIAQGAIDSGMRVGEWREKRDDSTAFLKTYKYGQITSTKIVGRDGKVFVPVERVPEFPGGMEAFGKFLDHTIRYPVEARKQEIQGRVIVSFVVERDGSLTDIKIKRGVNKIIDDEALRVMKLSPPWKPGMQNGRAVRVAYSVPITFTIN